MEAQRSNRNHWLADTRIRFRMAVSISQELCPLSDCLSVENGTSSKRNFHRPAIELRNAPEFRLPSLHSVLITSAARNPMDTIATTINGHSATTQKEMIPIWVFTSRFSLHAFSQAFEDRHFTKRECERC